MKNRLGHYKITNIGSVSHGTMRPEDLIPEFLCQIRRQSPTRRAHMKLHSDVQRRMNQQGEEYWEDGNAQSDLEELFDALNTYAPPYFYFGAHPGDGSDYGFWLSEDFENEFDGLKVSDLSEVPSGYTGEVLDVNDHGNMSLYKAVRGRLYPLLAIV